MNPKLLINLLGEFRLEYEGSPLSAFSADRLQSLLAYLLLHRSAPQPRHHLAFQLWPDSSESQSRTNLRNLLHNLRANLPEPATFLDITNLTLQWRPDGPYRLDIEEFAAGASGGRRKRKPPKIGRLPVNCLKKRRPSTRAICCREITTIGFWRYAKIYATNTAISSFG